MFTLTDASRLLSAVDLVGISLKEPVSLDCKSGCDIKLINVKCYEDRHRHLFVFQPVSSN